ncbi:MAG TPA: Ig-like domain-containing protein [Vicinamibacterales bacterium]|nr:Ig-like domain-containing protein [Vicinamibacterales bacterium]
MLAQTRRLVGALFAVVVLLTMTAWGCDKLPLLAPTGTVISLFPSSTVLPVNGSIDITAVAIEAGSSGQTPTPTPTPPTTPGQPTTPTTPTPTPGTPGTGTPVHNGTVISFTTTVGRIEPNEAPTHNGQVTVKLIAEGQSGTARITAFSGGARSAEIMVNVGTAAVERVLLRADNQNLPASGGTTRLIARVEDVGGAGLAGVPVTFTTTAGRLEPSSSTTDSIGEAVSTLSTALEANVTASAGSKTSTPALVVRINPRSGLTITGPTTPPPVGVPASFTVGVAAAALVNNVVINWGDGGTQPLGSLSGNTTVQHIYNTQGTFTVTATGTTAFGDTESTSTAITILPAQPPSVLISVSPQNPPVNTAAIVTATVTGATSTITNYSFNFGDPAAIPPSTSGTSNQVSVQYTTTGPKVIIVTVTQAAGPNGQGQTVINVVP